MNNLQNTLLFPVRDPEARKQFLFASLVMLAGFIIPILPMLILTGYSAKIMRQIIEEKKDPSMPDWQNSDWSEMLLDGLRMVGAQFVYMLPVIIAMGFGMLSLMSVSMAAAVSTSDNGQSLAPIGIPLFMAGFAVVMLLSLLAVPYSVIISPVGPHVAATRSFASAFQVKDWWGIFRKGLGQFILNYVIVMAVSWVFGFIIQLAFMTIVLMCIVPFIMVPYSAYTVVLRSALLAQAYAKGADNPIEG